MDIGSALTYMFEDERWLAKFAVAGGLLLLAVVLSFTIVIPIGVGVLFTGYSLRIVRNVRIHDPRPLPEWEDLGAMFVDGVFLTVALLVWALPLVLVYAPMLLLLVLSGGSGGDGPNAVGQLALMCGSCLVALYGMVLAFVQPAIYTAYVEQDSIAGALDVGRVLGIAGHHFGKLVLIAVVTFFVSLLGGLGVLLCFVGLLLTIPWATFVQAHLYGQLAAAAAGDLPEDTGGGEGPIVPGGHDEPIVPGGLDDVDTTWTPEDILEEVRDRAEDALGDDWDAGPPPEPGAAEGPVEGALGPPPEPGVDAEGAEEWPEHPVDPQVWTWDEATGDQPSDHDVEPPRGEE